MFPKIFLIFFFLLQLNFQIIFSHSHNNEPPHLKYSRELNEEAQKNSLKGHEHSHYDHEHVHDHDEDIHDDEHFHGFNHAHSHNSPDEKHQGPSHTHENKQKLKNTKEKLVENIFDSNGYMHFMNDEHIRVWVYSIGATILISAVPCFFLLFIPIRNSSTENRPYIKILLAFGAGGLLGDAFLHLIPHAIPASQDSHHSHSHDSHQHAHGHSHSHGSHDNNVGIYVLVGFMTFFIVEKFIRILRGDDSSHGHSHNAPVSKKLDTSTDSKETEETISTCSTKESESKRMRVAAILNLVADAMHNFTDGMSIGASFISGTLIGLGTMAAAMKVQLLTAIGALAGCILSLWSVRTYETMEAATQSWIIPFTAGGFIYIATVSIIPELLLKSSFKQSVCEIIAILIGLFMMYLIAIFE